MNTPESPRTNEAVIPPPAPIDPNHIPKPNNPIRTNHSTPQYPQKNYVPPPPTSFNGNQVSNPEIEILPPRPSTHVHHPQQLSISDPGNVRPLSPPTIQPLPNTQGKQSKHDDLQIMSGKVCSELNLQKLAKRKINISQYAIQNMHVVIKGCHKTSRIFIYDQIKDPISDKTNSVILLNTRDKKIRLYMSLNSKQIQRAKNVACGLYVSNHQGVWTENVKAKDGKEHPNCLKYFKPFRNFKMNPSIARFEHGVLIEFILNNFGMRARRNCCKRYPVFFYVQFFLFDVHGLMVASAGFPFKKESFNKKKKEKNFAEVEQEIHGFSYFPLPNAKAEEFVRTKAKTKNPSQPPQPTLPQPNLLQNQPVRRKRKANKQKRKVPKNPPVQGRSFPQSRTFTPPRVQNNQMVPVVPPYQFKPSIYQQKMFALSQRFPSQMLLLPELETPPPSLNEIRKRQQEMNRQDIQTIGRKRKRELYCKFEFTENPANNIQNIPRNNYVQARHQRSTVTTPPRHPNLQQLRFSPQNQRTFQMNPLRMNLTEDQLRAMQKKRMGRSPFQPKFPPRRNHLENRHVQQQMNQNRRRVVRPSIQDPEVEIPSPATPPRVFEQSSQMRVRREDEDVSESEGFIPAGYYVRYEKPKKKRRID